MTDQITSLPWTRPDWLAQASAWIQVNLERRGLTISGPIEQPHLRPWSTVLRAPTPSGVIYFFKAVAPALAHEPALTEALSRWRPDCLPQVLVIDAERGWLLLGDGGPTLRSLIQIERDIRHWHRVLPLYAGLQIELASRLDELLALGALDRRLATLPAQYERLLADTAALRLDQPGGLAATEYRRLQELKLRFAAMCEELAGYGLPETLHHDDLHDGNIFVRDGRYSFFDWGESSVAHPFFTMVVTLRSIAYQLQLGVNDPALVELRDIYLEPWLDYGPRQHLLAAYSLAQQLGTVCRALTWYRVVSHLPDPLKAEHAEAVPGWLQEFLEAQAKTENE